MINFFLKQNFGPASAASIRIRRTWLYAFGLLFLVSLNAPAIWAQSVEVKASTLATGGKVQIQKEGERVWRTVDKKINISDGDILKTGYKSFVVIQVGEGNIVVVGSDSRALLNFGVYEGELNLEYTTTVTVFEGGVYFKWYKQSFLNVFTSNAVGRIAEGIFAAAFEPDAEKSTFTVMKSKLVTGNISRTRTSSTDAGFYTTISQDGDSEHPIPISAALVEKLRVYFGESFVAKELEANGLQIKDQDAVKAKSEPRSSKDLDVDIKLRTFFKGNDVFGNLDKKLAGERSYYQPPIWYDPVGDYNRFLIESGFHFSSALGEIYPGFYARGIWKSGKIKLGFNLPLESGQDGFKVNTFGSGTGLLDKLYLFDYTPANGRYEIHIGEIQNLTYNRGLLVRNFSNALHSQIEQPRGLVTQYHSRNRGDLHVFIADLSNPSLIGSNYLYDNGLTAAGFSAVFDLNQGGGLTIGDAGFNAEAAPIPSVPSATGLVWAWDAYLEFNVLNDPPFFINGYGGISFLYEGLSPSKGGRVFQAPGVEVYYKKWSLYFEGFFTDGEQFPGYFNDFYLEDRTRMYTDTASGKTYGLSQTERLGRMESERGARVGIDYQLLKGLWLGFGGGQNIGSGKIEANLAQSGNPSAGIRQTSTPGLLNRDRFATARVFLGGDFIQRVPRFEMSYTMYSGKLGRHLVLDTLSNQVIPQTAPEFEDKLFFSLNTVIKVAGEFKVLSNASVVASYTSYSLDLITNGIYDAGEMVSEFGLQWRMKL